MSEENFFGFFGHRLCRVDGLSNGVCSLHCIASLNRFKPALDVGKVIEVLALPVVQNDPRITGDIGDGVSARDELAIGQTLIEYAVEPLGLFDITIDRIGNFLSRIISEVMILPEHRPEAAHLPEQPFHRLRPAAQIARKKLAGLLGEILENRAGLEHVERPLAVSGFMIHDRRDAVVRRNREKLRRKLLAFADVDRLDLIGKTGLFQKDRDLVAVWCGPVVQIDHGGLLKKGMW